MHKYEIVIYWGNEEAALEHIGQAVKLWLETAR